MERMLTEETPRAVSIASASSHHLDAATQALASGASILLEKPVVLTSQDGERLREVADRSEGFVLPGHVLRFSWPYRELHRRISAGQVGSLLMLAFRRHRQRETDVLYPDIHPVFMTTIHDLDLAIWYTGTGFDEVTAGAVKDPRTNQPGAVWAQARASDGSMCSFQVSWLLPDGAPNDDTVEILGTDGALQLDRDMALQQSTPGRRLSRTRFPNSDLVSALTAEVSYFVRCVQRCEEPEVVTLDDALRGIALAERIVEQCAAVPVVGGSP